ncbi:MAG: hypothetical protein AMJ54_10360 [Deltaproteobacteria bacterium SG8_13]|nr:MAG: hypothetical protein AMJ54_10360 [Deltaproteobacteria bacterium SG8_13]
MCRKRRNAGTTAVFYRDNGRIGRRKNTAEEPVTEAASGGGSAACRFVFPSVSVIFDGFTPTSEVL